MAGASAVESDHDGLGDALLVPLDGSAAAEHAIPYALALAPPGATLVLVRVVPDPELERALTGGEMTVLADRGLEPEREEARQDLDRVVARLGHAAVRPRIDAIAAVGDPTAEILRVVRERSVWLIVVASHARGTFGRLALGSVADQLARTAPVPVLIVRADESVPALVPAIIRRLVVPLDGSGMATRAIPVAERLALQLDLPVRLLTVIDAAETTAALADAAEDWLDRAGTQLRRAGVETSGVVTEGTPAVAIRDATEPGDLLVMASHGRGGLTRLLVGSVAEEVVHRGPVPVLLVRGGDERPATDGDRSGA